MRGERLKDFRVPVIRINRKLEPLKGKVLFPEKVALANELISRATFPADLKR